MTATQIPEKLPIEFRGRNGWARFESAHVHGLIGNGDPIAIEMYSRRRGEYPPIVIAGEREEVRALLQGLIDQIDQQTPGELNAKAAEYRHAEQEADARSAAYRHAHAAGWDAGNRSMQAAGRTVWNVDDAAVARSTINRILEDAGVTA